MKTFERKTIGVGFSFKKFCNALNNMSTKMNIILGLSWRNEFKHDKSDDFCNFSRGTKEKLLFLFFKYLKKKIVF